MDKRQPADNNKAYYYHFDGLGSVVALSNSNGDSCQSYQYSVYGQVAASDPNHPNPYMFTGRRFDIETGLYYYRARYYNPHIGRFMQTDPVGYGAGINWYLYCGNNPVGFVDPMGLAKYFYDASLNNFYELTGKWNLEGISLIYNVTPGAIEEIEYEGDIYYIYGGTVEEKARYVPEGEALYGQTYVTSEVTFYTSLWSAFWEDVIEWTDAVEYCGDIAQDLDFLPLDDKYKYMYVSYNLSEMAGPFKATLIGLGNEVQDMVFGEGFNVGDVMANSLGIQEQQSGTTEDDAVEIFEAAAPIIQTFDVKVRVIVIPGIGTYIFVY